MSHPAKFISIQNFLPETVNRGLLAYAIANQNRFQNSTVTTGDIRYRESQVLYRFPQAEIFRNNLKQFLRIALDALDMDMISIGDIECQMTSHGNGGYFKPHVDNSGELTGDRRLTYVYYFNKQPKGFDGGHLLLFEKQPDGSRGDKFQSIPPQNNTLVLFPSDTWHEVQPTRVPTNLFERNRFTVNGWVREFSKELDIAPSLAIHP